jgi:hypothetical protein
MYPPGFPNGLQQLLSPAAVIHAAHNGEWANQTERWVANEVNSPAFAWMVTPTCEQDVSEAVRSLPKISE